MKFVVCLTLLCSSLLSAAEINFDRDIRSLLSDKCFHCHGPDGGEFGERWKGGLRLDTEEGAKTNLSEVKLMVKNAKRKAAGKKLSNKKSKPRFAIVPGKPEESTLIERVFTDDEDDVMPPSDSNHSLSDKEKNLLKEWIKQGAVWGEHWSFVAPTKSNFPKVNAKAWIKNEVDYFVLNKLEKNNISPAPAVDKTTWIRRASLDLTGLPPTPQEVNSFLADDPAKSYEKVVDRLLSSKNFAERMTLEWLDAARYADTNGYQYDTPRTMWPWRDWVINSFQKNMPYDQFVTEQLAGDLLPNATLQQKIATGFNRNHGFTIEGGIIDEEYRIQYVNDRVITFGTVFLGLTMDCTRCHNHKYDPLTAKDFYSISAFFDKINEKGQGPPRGALAIAPMIDVPVYDVTNVKRLEKELNVALKTPLSKKDLARYKRWYNEFFSKTSSLGKVAAISTGGSTVEKLPDDSFKFTGKVPGQDTYTFTANVPKGIYKSLSIEALPDPSMMKNGPGRAENGNGVLTFVELQVADSNGKFKQHQLKEAYADHAQNGHPVSNLLGNNNKGWSIEGYRLHDKRIAAISLQEPLKVKANKQVKIKLHFKSPYPKHSFGRVKVNLYQAKAKDTFSALKIKKGFKNGKASKAEFMVSYKKSFNKKIMGLVSKIQKEKKKVVQVMVMEEKPSIRNTHLLERGEYDQKGEKVTAITPAFLPPLKKDLPRNRLGLAKWLVDDTNPLFSRVTVNRYWQMLFGIGLVKTTEDFGAQGEKPSHQKLLDWLAVDFRENNWDVRKIFKKMVLSATYRQSSNIRKNMEDPENRLLARGARFRLSGEIIRDQAIFAAGMLSDKTGGPSVFPYQPAGLWMELTNRVDFQMRYKNSTGDDLYRKSMYTFWKRALPHPSMTAFDAPERDVCVVNRAQTNTPLQALTLLHDPTYVEAARVLAAKSLKRNKNDVKTAIIDAFCRVLTRKPVAEEIDILLNTYKQKIKVLKKRPELITGQLSVGEYKNDNSLNQLQLAAFTTVCHTLFNLSETITRN